MNTDSFFELEVTNVPSVDEDILVSELFALGAEGVAEDLEFTQPLLEYEAKAVHRESTQLKAYFRYGPSIEELKALFTRYPHVNYSFQEKASQDWLEEWKKGYTAFLFVEGIWIVPSWETPSSNISQYLQIDPGMAFGTGTHETTRIAAELLVKSMKSYARPAVLDVGTGTGILAMVAELKGASRVLGIENDEGALPVAQKNLEQNRMTSTSLSLTPLEEIQDTYDVVIANIVDGVLSRLQASLWSRLPPGGSLVLSGILREREAIFLESFKPWTHAHEESPFFERLEMGDWIGYLLTRRK